VQIIYRDPAAADLIDFCRQLCAGAVCTVDPIGYCGRCDAEELCSFSARQIAVGNPSGEKHGSLLLVTNNDWLNLSKFFLSKKVMTNRVNF